jgi:hypothetical protein
MMMSQTPERGGDTTTIAVLSWALAAVSVEPATTPAARWLAVHPADASLAARLAGAGTGWAGTAGAGTGNRIAATCRF